MIRRVLLLSLVLASSGCVSGLWGLGLPDDGPMPAGVVPNGVVLTTGPGAWQEAAQRMTLSWAELLPEGLVFDSNVLVDPARGQTMLVEPPPSWDAALLRPGQVALDVGPGGLTLGVDVTLEPVVVTLEADGQPVCFVEVSVADGRLTGILTLTKTKLGVVNLSVVGEAALREGDADVVLSTCHDDILERSGHPDGPEALALGALATAAFEALIPSVATTLPTCLGLNLAGATTVSYDDGGVGAGWQHTVIRAPLVTPSPWWQFASGHLVVPYSVGVSAELHACAPDVPLPVAVSAAVPVVESDWALLVNRQLVARQVAAIWGAGGLCGDRVSQGSSWSASDWAPAWPPLGDLDPEMSVSARVWPESAPQLTFDAQPDGSQVTAHIDAGVWSVELMGWREGARVRLATLRAAVSLRASVVIETTGEIWLSTQSVDVDITETTAGLLSPPEPSSSAQTLETIVRGVVEALPLWVVPSVPSRVTPTVELHDGYLVIRDL